MDNPISILFYLKRVKGNAQGLAPIFQRITCPPTTHIPAPMSL